jgi:hypothetical protein
MYLELGCGRIKQSDDIAEENINTLPSVTHIMMTSLKINAKNNNLLAILDLQETMNMSILDSEQNFYGNYDMLLWINWPII